MFDLARNIDVHTESQGDASEKVVAGVDGGLIALGQDVTWSARHFGLPFRLTSKVTEFDSPNRFVDEQIRGPFQTFHHEHLFQTSPGGSVMIDRITLVAPFGPLGLLAEKLILGRYMQRLLENRGKFLAAL